MTSWSEDEVMLSFVELVKVREDIVRDEEDV